MKDEKSKITAVAIEKMMGVCKDDRGAGKCG